MKQQLLSVGIVLIAIYKLVESFAHNLEYGTLFSAQINIWVYRLIWSIAGGLSLYAILKSYKDRRFFNRK